MEKIWRMRKKKSESKVKENLIKKKLNKKKEKLCKIYWYFISHKVAEVLGDEKTWQNGVSLNISVHSAPDFQRKKNQEKRR